jgi:hypothetical protein
MQSNSITPNANTLAMIDALHQIASKQMSIKSNRYKEFITLYSLIEMRLEG